MLLKMGSIWAECYREEEISLVVENGEHLEQNAVGRKRYR